MGQKEIEEEIRVRKELSKLSDDIAEDIDLLVNEDVLENKKRGFILFIFDFSTGVTNYTSSIFSDDALEIMRFWLKTVEEANAKKSQ